MKTAAVSLTALIFALFFTVAAKAQVPLTEITVEADAQMQNSTWSASSWSNGWLMPSTHSDCKPQAFLMINSNTGNYKYITTPSGFAVSSVIQSSPNEFICAGVTGYESDVLDFTNAGILKTDSSGNVKFLASFKPFKAGNLTVATFFPFSKSVVSSSGDIYAIAPMHYVGKISKDGKPLWIRQYINISDIAWTDSGLVTSSADHIFRMDTAGNVVKDFNLPGHNFMNMQLVQSHLKYVYNNSGKLYTLNSNWQLIDSFQFPGLGFLDKKLTAVVYVTDSGYCFGQHDSLACYDFKGVLKWKRGLPADVSIMSMTGSQDSKQLAIAGATSDIPFIKAFDLEGREAPIAQHVTIAAVIPKKVTVHTSGFITNINADLEVTIVNNTYGTVDSLYLKSYGTHIGYSYACYENNLTAYKGIKLMTGASTKLMFSVSRTMVNPVGGLYQLDINIFAQSPNGKLQGDTFGIKYHYYKTFSGIEKDNFSENNVLVYPNPVSDILNLENSAGVANSDILITDLTGKMVFENHALMQKMQIDFSRLPAGIYFLKLQNESGKFTRKVIKE